MYNRICAFALVSVISFAAAASQEIARELRYPMRWDGTHGVAFVGTGIKYPSHPPLHSYLESGFKRGPDVNIFRDFPDADHVLIDDVAAGPRGTTIVACILNFGDKLVRHVILSYSDEGKLSAVIDTDPYYAAAITVDEAGTIYALANRIDVSNVKAIYPLLLAYSPDGRLVNQGLPSGSLKRGFRSINDASDQSSAVMSVIDGHLVFYAPESREIVSCTSKGEVLKRIDLSALLTKFANEDDAVKFSVQSVSFSGKIALIQFYTAKKDGGRKFRITALDMESAGVSILRSSVKPTWKILGAYGHTYAVIELSPVAELKTLEIPE